jgi:thioredoxin 1
MVTEISENELETLIKEKKIVIVDFSAVWCGPCKNLGKLLEDKVAPQLASHPDVALVKIDIDKNRGLASGLQIMGVPTMMFFFKGKRVMFEGQKGQEDRIVGFVPNIADIIMEIVKNLESQPDSK